MEDEKDTCRGQYQICHQKGQFLRTTLPRGNTEEKGQVWTFCQDWGWVGERENQEPKCIRTVHSSEKYLSFPVEKPVL